MSKRNHIGKSQHLILVGFPLLVPSFPLAQSYRRSIRGKVVDQADA